LLLYALGKKGWGLLLFSFLHLAIILTVGLGLDQWLARYE